MCDTRNTVARIAEALTKPRITVTVSRAFILNLLGRHFHSRSFCSTLVASRQSILFAVDDNIGQLVCCQLPTPLARYSSPFASASIADRGSPPRFSPDRRARMQIAEARILFIAEPAESSLLTTRLVASPRRRVY